MKQKNILIITGPTATGKTAFAIKCAKLLNGEIISADSMQIYKELNIGTAKQTSEELSLAKHHMVNSVDPDEEFSVQQFVDQANKIIEQLFLQNKLPIIVGGTGLYIKSLIYPYSFCGAPKDEEIRNKYKKLLDEKGREYLYSLLVKKDPNASEKIHVNDTKRVIRALEICDVTGTKKTNLNNEGERPRYNFVMIGLNLPREQLYERINVRVEKMFDDGLLSEIENLLKQGKVRRDSQSMQAIGYKEFFKYFDGELSLDEVKELISKNTRNYAKRQITFMKKLDNIVWFNPLTQGNEVIEYVKNALDNN